MTTFIERLRQAAKHAGAGETQAEIASSLGLARQTVNRWFKGGEPNAEQTFRIAKAWGIDPGWLKSEVGTMLPNPSPDGLSAEERDIIRNYRSATPTARDVIRLMTRAARKSMVAIAMAIPPFLVQQPAEASTLHNADCGDYLAKSMSLIHIVRLWLAALIQTRPITL